jgi:hypothetical protein
MQYKTVMWKTVISDYGRHPITMLICILSYISAGSSKLQDAGEHFRASNFVICSLRQILLGVWKVCNTLGVILN